MDVCNFAQSLSVASLLTVQADTQGNFSMGLQAHRCLSDLCLMIRGPLTVAAGCIRTTGSLKSTVAGVRCRPDRSVSDKPE